MRRKLRVRRDPSPPVEAEAPVDVHEGFWAGDDLAEGDATAIAAVDEDHTLEYGRKARPDVQELAAMAELLTLATWAEDKACRPCRSRLEETHDPAALDHDECRTALRVARLLSRYPSEPGPASG
jgi:hypothetical protein